jgi:hypothetical protein
VYDKESAVRIAAHRQNIRRCRKLLQTGLTAAERGFLYRRIAEEEAELQLLTAESDSSAVRDFAAHRRARHLPASGGDSRPTSGC